MRAPFCATILAISLIFNVAQASAPEKKCVTVLDHLVQKPLFVVKNGVYSGLSESGIKELSATREKLLETEKVANTQLYGLGVVVDLYVKLAAMEANILAYGAPGSAKTLSVQTIFNPNNVAVSQITAATSKESIFGGPSRAAMEAGNYNDINWQGAPITRPFQNIDDIQNGNADFLGSLGGAINEKKVFIGAVPLDVSNVKSYVFTTNATLHDLIEFFVLSGNPSYGPAFLNRLHSKFYFHNFGDSSTRIKIAELNANKASINALASSEASLKEHLLLKSVPADLNYTALRDFAHASFEISPEARSFIQDLAERIKQRYRAYRDEVESKISEQDKSTVAYYPSVDLSDRIAGKTLEDMVKISVAIDYLKSSLSSDPKIMSKALKEKKVINPISAWRLFPLMTTVLAKNDTVFDPYALQIYFAAERRDKHTVKVFDEEYMKKTFSKKTDELNYEHQKKEREIFAEEFIQLLKLKTKTDKEIAEQIGLKEKDFDLNNIDFSEVDIEYALFSAGSKNLVQVKSTLKANE